MKKIMARINMFAIFVMTTGVAMAAKVDANNNGLCKLIEEMHDVFALLRTLAFVGAAFYIADWAWGFIKDGAVKKDDLKDKSIGLLVAFVLLFSIGAVLTFFLSSAGKESIGCENVILNW